VSLFLASIYPTGAPANGATGLDAAYFVSGYLFAEFIIGNDGILYGQEGAQNATRQPIGPWIDPQVGMSLYECRATAQDTTPPSGTYDEWLDLAQTWGWALDVRQGRTRAWGDIGISGPLTETWTDKEGTFLLEIRRKSDQVVVSTTEVTVSAAGNA
jgi:hypothetical protein